MEKLETFGVRGGLAALGMGLALGVISTAVLPSQASACGGFWCSQSAPVNQAAEQIIFVDNPDETVTAIIQIQYQGPSDKFAWLLPIPGVPDIQVSSNIAFQNLQNATSPQYFLEQEVEGTCADGNNFGFGNRGGVATQDGSAAPEALPDGGGVSVEAEGSVGPYDFVVISLDSELPDVAEVAIDWLTDNGYDLFGTDTEVLGPYLEDGLNLLAFRLQKGNSSGAIRPVSLTYKSKLPMIPIRPTAVAANNDMGIRVWVVSDQQSVPKNYKSLVVNEALINWFCPTCNYDQVVTRAADESGGQGFVTELAGPSDDQSEVIWSPFDEQDWTGFTLQTFADPIDMIFEASWRYRGWDGWREAIEASVALPAGASFDDFGRNPDAYRGSAEVNTNTFLRELYEQVVKPVIDTQELLISRPYLTRLYSTMSADEMTMDPIFSFNEDLADVSNIHMATQIIECNAGVSYWEAPWRIELPQGGVIRGEGGQSDWPIALDDGLAANLKIVQLSERGSGDVVEDNTQAIRDALFELAGTRGNGTAMPEQTEGGMRIGGDLEPVEPEASSGGCSVGAAGNGGDLGWLLATALFLGLRRRR